MEGPGGPLPPPPGGAHMVKTVNFIKKCTKPRAPWGPPPPIALHRGRQFQKKIEGGTPTNPEVASKIIDITGRLRVLGLLNTANEMAMEFENNDELIIASGDSETLLKEVTEKLKTMDLIAMAKLQAALAAAMLRPIKQAAKLLEKASKAPKRASPHLRIFREWKEFVHADAKANGWPSFTSTKIDKTSKAETTTFNDASICVNGEHVFPTADAKGKYKGISPVQASSLAKQYWSQKEKKGTREDLWNVFYAKFQLENPEDSDEKSSASPAGAKVVISATEKAEKAAKAKADKEAQKLADKQKKEMEKELARKEKAANKLKELQEKAAALQLAIDSPEAVPKKPRAKKAVAAVEVAKASTPAVSTDSPTPKVVSRPKKAVVAAYVDTFEADADGDLKEWTFKGVTYYRSPLNALYDEEQNFLGVFDKTTATIKSDVANPDDE